MSDTNQNHYRTPEAEAEERRFHEFYGAIMLSWIKIFSFAEGIVILLLAEENNAPHRDIRLLKFLSDEEELSPHWFIMKIKECGREKYDEFAPTHFKIWEDEPFCNFDEFIEKLHEARKARNRLAHDISVKVMDFMRMDNGVSKQYFTNLLGFCRRERDKITPVMYILISFWFWLASGEPYSKKD